MFSDEIYEIIENAVLFLLAWFVAFTADRNKLNI